MNKERSKIANPYYEMMLERLKKMDGKRLKVRQRPMIPLDFPAAEDERRIAQVVGAWASKYFSEGYKP